MGKKFGNKIYTGMCWCSTKPEAQRRAASYRKHGNLARVVPDMHNGKKMWHLYVR